MKNYVLTDIKNWDGRKSNKKLYLHEKIECLSMDDFKKNSASKSIALLGYASDSGVERNHGRIGAAKGPDAIRRQLGKFANHLPEETSIFDLGNLTSPDGDVEAIQKELETAVDLIKKQHTFPIILGGGHDLAYGHYNGLLKHIPEDKTLAIINFDAHFDLRPNDNGSNSGTPFYQIAMDLQKKGKSFHYKALGVTQNANTKDLFDFAEKHKLNYLRREYFSHTYLEHVQLRLIQFMEDVDYIYTTIDLDGFSSAYAPGVSAASPAGFSPDIVLECVKLILESDKLVGLDIVELNPKYDIDDQTAKLAATIVHYILHKI
ncbi:formimidoylglutamase [Maribacter sp. X9]|uniref:formimidoylglutamase n=1 Tax=Maribacter sp. X9 TaxID=3402159 RepID=UPI003AF3C677